MPSFVGWVKITLIRSRAGFEVCLHLIPQILVATLCVRVGDDVPEGCLLHLRLLIFSSTLGLRESVSLESYLLVDVSRGVMGVGVL